MLVQKARTGPFTFSTFHSPEGAGASMRVKCWGQTSGRSRFRLSVRFYKWTQLIDHPRRYAFHLRKLIYGRVRPVRDYLFGA